MEFASKVETIYKNSCMSYTLLAAKEIGIFDVLKAASKPMTSHQIAGSRKLKERYVREILGSLASARLVETSCPPPDQPPTYHLLPQVKEELDKGTLTRVSQLKILMAHYSPVMECLPLDGPRGVRFGSVVFDCLDENNRSWRNAFIMNAFLDKVPSLQEKLEQGIHVMEVGSGSGHLLSLLASRFPRSHFTASDCSNDLVTQMEVRWDRLPNLRFHTVELCRTPAAELARTFDWIIAVQVIHNLPHPPRALAEIQSMLKPDGGVFTMIDPTAPKTLSASVGRDDLAVLFSFSTFMCIPESFQAEDSEACGASWSTESAQAMLEDAGFNVRIISVSILNDQENMFYCT